MGGIEFLLYNNFNLSIEFIKAFMNMKSRGPNDTTINTYSTIDITNLNSNSLSQIYSNLTKNDIATYIQWNFTLGYHRLSINDNSFNASQPFTDPIQYMINKKVNGQLFYPMLKSRPIRQLICNGEIYNYNDLVTEFDFKECNLSSTCDVEIILPLYIKNYDSSISCNQCLTEALDLIDGDYVFVLTENINTYILDTVNCFAVRDKFGVKPLYYVKNILNNIYIFISEMKGLPLAVIENKSFDINYVLPGNYWSFQNSIIHPNINNDFIEYYSIDRYKDLNNCVINTTDPDTLNNVYKNIRLLIEEMIISRYSNSQKSVGILLSGGFDSCIITTLLVKHLVHINHDFILNPIHIFTVGDTLGNDDLDNTFATNLINFLETKYNIILNHHIININEIEILTSDINNIIYALETYEPVTVRDSIPFYYLLRYISENTNVKVLITGDGLNQLCGYQNFKGLNDQTFQEKSVELIKKMYQHTLLRTDKISGNFGLEIRQPFINTKFIEYILSIHPKIKREINYSNEQLPITKYIIRKTFETSVYGEEILPDTLLWRTQSRLSDTLTNLNLRLNNYFESYMSDDLFNSNMLILNTENQNQKTLPRSKEQMYYRMFFRKYFPNRDYIVDIFWDDIWNE